MRGIGCAERMGLGFMCNFLRKIPATFYFGWTIANEGILGDGGEFYGGRKFVFLKGLRF